jgi:hypothetical protein
MRRRALAVVALLGGAAGGARAQAVPPLTPLDAPSRTSSIAIVFDATPDSLARVPVESLPPFERPNGMLLRPGTFVYQLSSRRDTLVTPLGQRTVVVTETSFAGSPSWLIAESRTGTAVTTTDSLFLARADLSPARWLATNGTTQLASSFSRDSMFVAMQSYQGRASVVTALPPGALLTPGMVDRLVELLPLASGFRAGATIVLFEMGTPRPIPAEIRVEREEPVPLGDRSVDCWVVTLRAGVLEERLWVTKETPRVVKTEQATGAGVLTAVLAAPVVPAGVPAAPIGATPP